MDQDPSAPKKPKPSDSFLKFTGLGIQLLVAIGLAAWGGYALDQYIGIRFPAFTLTFVFAAFGGSLYMLIKSLNQ